MDIAIGAAVFGRHERGDAMHKLFGMGVKLMATFGFAATFINGQWSENRTDCHFDGGAPLALQISNDLISAQHRHW